MTFVQLKKHELGSVWLVPLHRWYSDAIHFVVFYCQTPSVRGRYTLTARAWQEMISWSGAALSKCDWRTQSHDSVYRGRDGTERKALAWKSTMLDYVLLWDAKEFEPKDYFSQISAWAFLLRLHCQSLCTTGRCNLKVVIDHTDNTFKTIVEVFVYRLCPVYYYIVWLGIMRLETTWKR